MTASSPVNTQRYETLRCKGGHVAAPQKRGEPMSALRAHGKRRPRQAAAAAIPRGAAPNSPYCGESPEKRPCEVCGHPVHPIAFTNPADDMALCRDTHACVARWEAQGCPPPHQARASGAGNEAFPAPPGAGEDAAGAEGPGEGPETPAAQDPPQEDPDG